MRHTVHLILRRTTGALSLATGLLLAAPPAGASAYGAALKARNYPEAERAANAALAADPADAAALAAKSAAILALAPDSRIDEAVGLAEQCVAAHPRQSECHEALGNALGTKAINAGIFSAMGYAGKIRDALRCAVALDPHNMPARFSLLQYFLSAPSIVGGGVANARELVAQTAPLNAAASQLMQAQLDLHEGDAAKAERLAQAAAGAPDDALAGQRRDVLWAIGGNHLAAKRYADAERLYGVLQAGYPNSELGPFGLARSLQEQGKHAQALPLFEQAAQIYPRAFIYYRMGQSLQAAGTRAKALAAYAQALALAPGLPSKQKSDAENQVHSLKG